MNSKINIVIVNWNAGTQLADVISSIAKFHSGIVDSVVIVDNASTDNSLVLVQESFKQLPFALTIIHNLENIGFGAACNLGAAQTQSEYLLFLNPDAQLYEDTLTTVITFMQNPTNSNVGICGVKLADKENLISRGCNRFPSATVYAGHAIGVDRIFPKIGHFMAEWDHADTRQVDHVIGAFFLVRSNLFKVLKGFDERFFVYLEDLDFSYRAHLAGWDSVYLATAQAFHAGGGTSDQIKARRLFYVLRSRVIYAFKHFSWFGASIVLLATLLIEPITRSALTILKLSWSGFAETWAAYRMLWIWLFQWILKGATR